MPRIMMYLKYITLYTDFQLQATMSGVKLYMKTQPIQQNTMQRASRAMDLAELARHRQARLE